MNRKIACLVLLAMFSIQLSVLVYAQAEIDPLLKTFLDMIGIPVEWQKMPELLYYLIVPFVGIWGILLGFLRTIKIFQYSSRLELVITFAIAFSTVWPTGWLMLLVKGMFAFMGFFAVFAFGALFIVGVGAYSLFRGSRYLGIFRRRSAATAIISSYKNKIDNLRAVHEKKAMELAKAIAAGDTSRADKLKDDMEKIEQDMEKAKAAMKY